MSTPVRWQGGHVRDVLGVEVGTDASRSIIPVDRLVGVALRRNPRRAHLLVSTVLAKHVPTVPGVALAAGELLGLLVSRALDEAGAPDPAVVPADAGLGDRLADLIGLLDEHSSGEDAARVARAHADLAGLRRDIRSSTTPHGDAVTLGFAETATGLGQIVADALGAYYLHSTRHAPEGAAPAAGFAEEHSHATDHSLLPTDTDWLRPDGTVVLVDDELSTGATIVNTVGALHALAPQRLWVIASLIDLRSPADRGRLDDLAASLGTRIRVVSLAAGPISLPGDVLERAAGVVAGMPEPAPAVGPPGAVRVLDASLLPAVRSARFGTVHRVDADAAAAVAGLVRAALPDPGGAGGAAENRGVLVVGAEEFIALPMTVAHELDRAGAGGPVLFSTSTRSPIAVLDTADYPIASAIRFRSHDRTSDGEGERFAYNLLRSGRGFGTVVFLPEPGTDPALLAGPGGAIEALRGVTPHLIVVLLRAAHPTDGTPRP